MVEEYKTSKKLISIFHTKFFEFYDVSSKTYVIPPNELGKLREISPVCTDKINEIITELTSVEKIDLVVLGSSQVLNIMVLIGECCAEKRELKNKSNFDLIFGDNTLDGKPGGIRFDIQQHILSFVPKEKWKTVVTQPHFNYDLNYPEGWIEDYSKYENLGNFRWGSKYYKKVWLSGKWVDITGEKSDVRRKPRTIPTLKKTTDNMNIAVHNGHLDVLKWGARQIPPVLPSSMDNINYANHGERDYKIDYESILNWGAEHDIFPTFVGMNLAAENHDVLTLQWGADHNRFPTSEGMNDAAQGGDTDVLQWGLVQKPPIFMTPEAAADASAEGHFNVHRWAKRKNTGKNVRSICQKNDFFTEEKWNKF